MRAILQTLLLIGLIFILAVIAQQIAPLVQLTSYFDEYPQPYQAITIFMGLSGFVLLLSGLLGLLIRRGRPMTEEEARRFVRSDLSPLRRKRTFRGRAVGREVQAEVSFHDLKDAVRSGAWLRDADWRWFFLAFLGAALLFLGMFGFFFVIGRPLVKLIVGGAMVYAIVRTLWGLWKA